MKPGKSIYMVKKITMLMACCVIVFSALIAVLPAESAERKTFTSFGNISCPEWTANRKKTAGSGAFDNFASVLSESWLRGFLTAINGTVETEKDILRAIDSDAIMLWMDRYCIRNPKNDIMDGAIELVLELRKITQ